MTGSSVTPYDPISMKSGGPGALTPNLFAIVNPYIRDNSDDVKKVINKMEKIMDTTDNAIQYAVQAVSSGDKSKLEEAEKNVIRKRIAMVDSTTHMTTFYALAVLKNHTTPPDIVKYAKKVLELKKIILKNALNAPKITDSATLLKMYSESKDAKWEMLDTFSAVDLYYDTPSKYKDPPPTTNKSCDAKMNEYNTNTTILLPSAAVGQGSARQRKLLKYIANKGEELLSHMVYTRPGEKMTQNLLAWNRDLEPIVQTAADTTGIHGAMLPPNNCMVVDLDSFSSIPRMLTRMIHELSHLTAVGEGHSPVFYKNFRMLLRIATEELGWTVETTCRETCFVFDDNNPDPKKICPKCLWQTLPETCQIEATTCNPSPNEIEKLLKRDPNLSAKAKEFLTTKTRPVKK
jgi:hypothetical protein